MFTCRGSVSGCSCGVTLFSHLKFPSITILSYSCNLFVLTTGVLVAVEGVPLQLDWFAKLWKTIYKSEVCIAYLGAEVCIV